MKTIQLNGKNYGIVGIPANASEIVYKVFVGQNISSIEYKTDGTNFSAQVNAIVKDVISTITEEIKNAVKSAGVKFRNEVKVPENYSPGFKTPVSAMLNKQVELEVMIASCTDIEQEAALNSQLNTIKTKLTDFNEKNKTFIDFERDFSEAVEAVILVEV